MDTQVMRSASGPQPAYTPRVNPQAQSASTPLWVDPNLSKASGPYPRPPMQDRMAGPGPARQPQPQPRPEPVFNGNPAGSQGRVQRSVQERHEAFQRAAEALHDRHYEDNNIRLEAELRLAEFFLS